MGGLLTVCVLDVRRKIWCHVSLGKRCCVRRCLHCQCSRLPLALCCANVDHHGREANLGQIFNEPERPEGRIILDTLIPDCVAMRKLERIRPASTTGKANRQWSIARCMGSVRTPPHRSSYTVWQPPTCLYNRAISGAVDGYRALPISCHCRTVRKSSSTVAIRLPERTGSKP